MRYIILGLRIFSCVFLMLAAIAGYVSKVMFLDGIFLWAFFSTLTIFIIGLGVWGVIKSIDIYDNS